jgi:hypothetical protein
LNWAFNWGFGLMVALAILSGCAPTASDYPPAEPTPMAPTAPVPSERPREMQRAPAPVQRPTERATGIAVPDERQPVETTRATQAELVAYYRLDTVNMAVISAEALDSLGLGDEVAQQLRETFSELGMRVQNAAGVPAATTPDPAAVMELASRLDADLVTVVAGRAAERSRLGQMISAEATVRSTVYESGGHVVATKQVTTVGARSSRREVAERSALVAASEQLGPYLVEQIIRTTGRNVITRRLTVTGLQYHVSVMKLVDHLKRQPGINDVRLLHWDESSRTARLIVYLQPAARDNLGAYVAQTPGLEVRIIQSDTAGATGHERRIDR